MRRELAGPAIASKSVLPEFFHRITSRHRGVWRFYEKVATLFGVGIIGFTLIGLTYFTAFGNFPFVKLFEGGSPVIKFFGFLAGVSLGLCVHEFAHGIVLANNGIKIKQVGVVAGSIVGGFVEADAAGFFQADPRVHLRFNAASIGTNALAAVILGFFGLLTSSELLIFLALGSLFFGFINSFPVIPLDGGWVYEDLINLYLSNRKIKRILLSARFLVFVLWLVLFTHAALGQ